MNGNGKQEQAEGTQHEPVEAASASHRVGFIGAGNMDSALLRGMLRANCFKASQVRVHDVDADKMAAWKLEHGVERAESNAELAAWSTVLFLGVKPADATQVAAQCADSLRDDTLVISVMAGVRTETLAAQLPPACHVVRAMPNTPALVGAGATALCAGAGCTSRDLTLSKNWFDAVGTTVVVDESQMDAVTGLSGSGPAYVMLFVEALAEGGRLAGLPGNVAMALAAQTVVGAGQLLRGSSEPAAELRARVTSRGGTTAAGLAALQAKGFEATIAHAIASAAERSRVLGGKAKDR